MRSTSGRYEILTVEYTRRRYDEQVQVQLHVKTCFAFMDTTIEIHGFIERENNFPCSSKGIFP